MEIQGRERIHHQIHWASLILIVLALPLSKFLLSVGELLLVLNWLFWGDLKKKFKVFFHNRLALVLVSLFLLHVIGLIYSENLSYAFRDLRIKLPLLAFPILLATSPRLPLKKAKILFGVFTFALLCGVVSSMYAYFGFTERDLSDSRNLSLFISHIRFSLLLSLGVIGLVLIGIYEKKWRGISLVLASLYSGFMLLLGAISGLAALLVGLLVIAGYYAYTSKRSFLKWGFSLGVLVLIGGLVFIVGKEWKKSFSPPPITSLSLAEKSAGGEMYYNNLNRKEVENGNYVWVEVAWKELETAWEKESTKELASADAKGQPLLSTLVRYMASKALTKDSAGFQYLTPEDIARIEKGHTNFRFGDQSGLYHRLYKTLWEIDHYQKGGNPSGNSLTQRFEFWKTGYLIAKENPLIGVGTGDVRDAFFTMYEKTDTVLQKAYWHRAHNQFLTFLVTFGFLGFVWFLGVWLFPLWFFPKQVYLLPYLAFFVVFSISCLNEDTLETQIGATLYAFLNAFLLFGYSKYD